MLSSLTIKNIIIIENIKINFDDGLNIITGETGSGKSILLKSLSLLFGKNNSGNLLRNGCKEGFIEAIFRKANYSDLPSQDSNSNLVLKRKITKSKSYCYINDKKVCLSLMSKLANTLLEIHGQNDHVKDVHRQIEMIDKYANINTVKITTVFQEWKEKLVLLEELKLKINTILKNRDYLFHISQELKNLSLKQGEEEILKQQREKILYQKKNFQVLSQSRDQINAILVSLSKVYNLVNNTGNNELAGYLDRSYIELKEAYALTTSLIVESENESVDMIEERLFKLYNVSRKYGKKVDELYDYQIQITNSLSEINNLDNEILTLENECLNLEKTYISLAKELSEKRRNIASRLEKIIEQELLNLRINAEFKIEITEIIKEKWTKQGIDKVLFKASLNPGTKIMPLSEIASGGEMSRFILVLKTLNCAVPIIFFDEIDSGIGGSASDAVGNKLLNLSLKNQVIVITHQPQIAVKGKTHFRVEKLQKERKTFLNVVSLTGKKRVQEIARMIAGDNISTETLSAAYNLYSQNSNNN